MKIRMVLNKQNKFSAKQILWRKTHMKKEMLYNLPKFFHVVLAIFKFCSKIQLLRNINDDKMKIFIHDMFNSQHDLLDEDKANRDSISSHFVVERSNFS